VYVGVTVFVRVTVLVGEFVGDGVGALYIRILLLVPCISAFSVSAAVTVKGETLAVPKVIVKFFMPLSPGIKV
jgi:hypothetical protein